MHAMIRPFILTLALAIIGLAGIAAIISHRARTQRAQDIAQGGTFYPLAKDYDVSKGRILYLRTWDRVLSQEEMEQEQARLHRIFHTPRRRWWGRFW